MQKYNKNKYVFVCVVGQTKTLCLIEKPFLKRMPIHFYG